MDHRAEHHARHRCTYLTTSYDDRTLPSHSSPAPTTPLASATRRSLVARHSWDTDALRQSERTIDPQRRRRTTFGLQRTATPRANDERVRASARGRTAFVHVRPRDHVPTSRGTPVEESERIFTPHARESVDERHGWACKDCGRPCAPRNCRRAIRLDSTRLVAHLVIRVFVPRSCSPIELTSPGRARDA
jgi:hypothetical protein